MREKDLIVLLAIYVYIWSASQQFCWSKTATKDDSSVSSPKENPPIFTLLTLNYKNLLDNALNSANQKSEPKMETHTPKSKGSETQGKPEDDDDDDLCESDEDFPDETRQDKIDDGCSCDGHNHGSESCGCPIHEGMYSGCPLHGGCGCPMHRFSGMGCPYYAPFFGYDFIPFFHLYPFYGSGYGHNHCPFCASGSGCPLHGGSRKNNGPEARESGRPLGKKSKTSTNNDDSTSENHHHPFCPFFSGSYFCCCPLSMNHDDNFYGFDDNRKCNHTTQEDKVTLPDSTTTESTANLKAGVFDQYVTGSNEVLNNIFRQFGEKEYED